MVCLKVQAGLVCDVVKILEFDQRNNTNMTYQREVLFRIKIETTIWGSISKACERDKKEQSKLFIPIHHSTCNELAMKDKRNESRRKKTGLRGFRPGLTQTSLYSHRSRLEA